MEMDWVHFWKVETYIELIIYISILIFALVRLFLMPMQKKKKDIIASVLEKKRNSKEIIVMMATPRYEYDKDCFDPIFKAHIEKQLAEMGYEKQIHKTHQDKAHFFVVDRKKRIFMGVRSDLGKPTGTISIHQLYTLDELYPFSNTA